MVLARLMKGSWDATTAKDASIEGGILMVSAVGQLVASLITGLAAPALMRWAKRWRSDVHDGGYGAYR